MIHLQILLSQREFQNFVKPVDKILSRLISLEKNEVCSPTANLYINLINQFFDVGEEIIEKKDSLPDQAFWEIMSVAVSRYSIQFSSETVEKE